MTNTPTPRTDALFEQNPSPNKAAVVEFARTLERHLSVLRGEFATTTKAILDAETEAEAAGRPEGEYLADSIKVLRVELEAANRESSAHKVDESLQLTNRMLEAAATKQRELIQRAESAEQALAQERERAETFERLYTAAQNANSYRQEVIDAQEKAMDEKATVSGPSSVKP